MPRGLGGRKTVETAMRKLSTSETVVVALGLGRLDLLPPGYSNFRDAWLRLNWRQRRLVDSVARQSWTCGNKDDR